MSRDSHNARTCEDGTEYPPDPHNTMPLLLYIFNPAPPPPPPFFFITLLLLHFYLEKIHRVSTVLSSPKSGPIHSVMTLHLRVLVGFIFFKRGNLLSFPHSVSSQGEPLCLKDPPGAVRVQGVMSPCFTAGAKTGTGVFCPDISITTSLNSPPPPPPFFFVFFYS